MDFYISLFKDIAFPIISAALGYAVALKSKNAVLKQQLFQKQMEACSEIASMIPNVMSADYGKPGETQVLVFRFFDVLSKWEFFLPNQVVSALQELRYALTAYWLFGCQHKNEMQYGVLMLDVVDKDTSEELKAILVRARLAERQVVTEFRNLLGIEPLSKENIESFKPELMQKMLRMKPSD